MTRRGAFHCKPRIRTDNNKGDKKGGPIHDPMRWITLGQELKFAQAIANRKFEDFIPARLFKIAG
jgi:hypothetical protein